MPPELAGRDQVIEQAAIALDRIKNGHPDRGRIFYGLRGVGKTVLLNKIRTEAEGRDFETVRIEAPEERSLPSLLVPALRATILRLSRSEAARDYAARALRALAGFARGLKVSYADIEISYGLPEVETGTADSGELERDLVDLLTAVGQAAAARQTAVVLVIDELQYIKQAEFAALISAFHVISQDRLPVTMLAAGLPQLLGLAGAAKSYAERLFRYVPIGRLDPEAARRALCKPAQDQGAEFTEEAVAEILAKTLGYPYFLQEWGKHSWNLADRSPIELVDARHADEQAIAELDASFFRVRFDRLTPAEKLYMRAMADLGEGPHRSGEIAARLGKDVTSVAPLRNGLIRKGMIYSPAFGDTAFTVPLFDGFMKRIMPAWA